MHSEVTPKIASPIQTTRIAQFSPNAHLCTDFHVQCIARRALTIRVQIRSQIENPPTHSNAIRISNLDSSNWIQIGWMGWGSMEITFAVGLRLFWRFSNRFGRFRVWNANCIRMRRWIFDLETDLSWSRRCASNDASHSKIDAQMHFLDFSRSFSVCMGDFVLPAIPECIVRLLIWAYPNVELAECHICAQVWHLYMHCIGCNPDSKFQISRFSKWSAV